MKKLVSNCLYIIICTILLCGCKSDTNDEKESYTIKESCEIVESAEAICEKPMEKGIYTSKSDWDKAIKRTDVAVVSDRKDLYDEDFFADNTLVYIADVSSGNSQCEYEGFKIEELDGKTVLKIKVSYSTDKLLNKLHVYHVFFTINKSEADGVDDIELEVSSRD